MEINVEIFCRSRRKSFLWFFFFFIFLISRFYIKSEIENCLEAGKDENNYSAFYAIALNSSLLLFDDAFTHWRELWIEGRGRKLFMQQKQLNFILSPYYFIVTK